MGIVVAMLLLVAAPYVIAAILPDRLTLGIWFLFAGSSLAYFLREPRREPCGMLGGVLDFPEAQEVYVLWMEALVLGCATKFLTLHLRDRGVSFWVRMMVLMCGLVLLPFAMAAVRELAELMDIPLCWSVNDIRR
jgi:hypothetical protein